MTMINIQKCNDLGRESVERNPTLFLIGRVYGFIGILKLSSGMFNFI